MEAPETADKPPVAVAGLAAGGLIASLLASSCCILPLVLVSVGVGGTWMSTLTSLAPYQPAFLLAAAGSIGWGLRQAYRKQEVCAPGTVCAVPKATFVTKSLLWICAALAIAAAGVDTVLPYFI